MHNKGERLKRQSRGDRQQHEKPSQELEKGIAQAAETNISKSLTDRRRVLISYSTEHLPKKDKVRFFYALNGRGGFEGILPRTGTEHLGRAVLMIKDSHMEEFREFLNYWKCKWMELNIVLK
jgi:hypothetical protein